MINRTDPMIIRELYMATEGWKNFANIMEVDKVPDPTGIKPTVSESHHPSDIYTLDGQLLKSAPHKGIYIQNGKKVVVK